MISRRPKRCESSENAPGPRNPIAAAIITTRKVVSGESNKPGVVIGNRESATPALAKPTRMLAIGVSSPIRSKAPVITVSKPTAHVPSARLLGSVRHSPPWTAAVTPTVARKSRRPKPGPPPGNVENNLCSLCLLSVR